MKKTIEKILKKISDLYSGQHDQVQREVSDNVRAQNDKAWILYLRSAHCDQVQKEISASYYDQVQKEISASYYDQVQKEISAFELFEKDLQYNNKVWEDILQYRPHI